jgi:hypothetical protein
MLKRLLLAACCGLALTSCAANNPANQTVAQDEVEYQTGSNIPKKRAGRDPSVKVLDKEAARAAIDAMTPMPTSKSGP